MAAPSLPPPPVDTNIAQDGGKATPPWVLWLRQLWDAVRADDVSVIARLGAGQSVPPTAVTRVQWDTEDRDTHDAFATGASAAFTAPVAGLYHLSCFVHYGVGPVVGAANLEVQVNGASAAVLAFFSSGGTSAYGFTVGGSRDFSLSAGDVVSIHTYQDLGGAPQPLYNNALYNFLSIHRLGGVR